MHYLKENTGLVTITHTSDMIYETDRHGVVDGGRNGGQDCIEVHTRCLLCNGIQASALALQIVLGQNDRIEAGR